MNVSTKLTNLDKRLQIKEQIINLHKCPALIVFDRRDDGSTLYQLDRENGSEWITEEMLWNYLKSSSCEKSGMLTIYLPQRKVG